MHEEQESYRDLAMSQLTADQQDFIMNTLRRGKRSVWLNVLAERKGIVIAPEDDEEEIARKIGGWILERFHDRGEKDGRCECGTPIRYEYHVMHMESGDHLCLGSTCIEQYTGLDAKTVDAVIKGMKVFDLEKDEILGKVINNWTLPFNIPQDFTLPIDMKQHLDLELPLLDRQVSRLKKLIDKHRVTQTRSFPLEPNNLHGKIRTEQPTLDLFSHIDEAAVTIEKEKRLTFPKNQGNKEVPYFTETPDSWKAVVDAELQQIKDRGQEQVNALYMANYVASVLGYEQDRYLTGKPRTYFWVASYMDKVSTLEVIEASVENITYRFVR